MLNNFGILNNVHYICKSKYRVYEKNRTQI